MNEAECEREKDPVPKAYSWRGQSSRTLWMIPAEWIYYKRQKTGSASHTKKSPSTKTANIFGEILFFFFHLEAPEHLINEELHPVLRQPLHLHQLAEVGAHERHHQVTEGEKTHFI